MKVRIGQCKHCKGDLCLKQAIGGELFWQYLQCSRTEGIEKSNDRNLIGV